MQEFNIKAQKRTNAGKSYTVKIRREGLVPGVIYGSEEPVMIQIEEKQLKDLIYTPNVYIVKVDVDGKMYKCVKKEEQYHPVTDNLLHIDFYAISEDKAVKMYIPIKLNGTAEGVLQGGHLYQLKKYLNVKALPKYLPDTLDIDITNLQIGKTIKISDLKFDNIELLDSSSDLVIMVQMTRAAISKAESETK